LSLSVKYPKSMAIILPAQPGETVSASLTQPTHIGKARAASTWA
jgi:hypothetical protein